MHVCYHSFNFCSITSNLFKTIADMPCQQQISITSNLFPPGRSSRYPKLVKGSANRILLWIIKLLCPLFLGKRLIILPVYLSLRILIALPLETGLYMEDESCLEQNFKLRQRFQPWFPFEANVTI